MKVDRILRLVGSLALLLGVSGCVWIFRDVDVREVETPTTEPEPVVVESPVRAHLLSGRTVVFPAGARFADGEVTAVDSTGLLYDLNYQESTRVTSLSMDSIVAVESYGTKYNSGASVGVSLLATTGAVIGTPILLVALFGSCPTIYSDSPGGPILEAEVFPHSIVPLFEVRDVHPLGAQASPEGIVELEFRNEALETHYINHLELLEVQHAHGSIVLPAPGGRAFVLRDMIAPARAVDRAGRDVLPALALRDNQVFSTDSQTLARATPKDLTDHVDLVFPAPGTGSAVLVLRLRESLLNTVYFYDFMLAGQGPRALDWLGRDLQSISHAVEIGDFYARRMGLSVQVRDGGVYREAGKVGQIGPIAWDEVAVPVSMPEGDSIHVRLRFVADAWRIDEVTLTVNSKTVIPRRAPLSGIRYSATTVHSDPTAQAAAPDEAYLITMPGTRFWARFQVGHEPMEGRRTFLLAAQGYYTEWIRRDWLDETADSTPFVPSETTLHAAMERWRAVKSSFEARFETSKVPVH